MQLQQLGEIKPGGAPLRQVHVPRPRASGDELLLRITACGVCHTELDEIEGRTAPPQLPVIPGHQVIGYVEGLGPAVQVEQSGCQLGSRVGVGWIHHSCGGAGENLSPEFRATGRDVDGGYAEYMTVPARYAYPIPEFYSDAEAAPLLCAGGVGYRALRLTGLHDGQTLGLTGFGGSAHLLLQLVRYLYPNSDVYVFARDPEQQKFALSLGACWAGSTSDDCGRPLHAVIDTTPAWRPVLAALEQLRPGGRLVINAIRKQDDDRELMAGISYERHLWLEKEIKTVANVSAADLAEFLPLAAAAGIRPRVECYPLEQANQALCDLKFAQLRGAKVLTINPLA
ncbi:MAG: zinc-dependent alcohol dehydrogenase family protein [Wenzhouxiangellaceae bacterium]